MPSCQSSFNTFPKFAFTLIAGAKLQRWVINAVVFIKIHRCSIHILWKIWNDKLYQIWKIYIGKLPTLKPLDFFIFKPKIYIVNIKKKIRLFVFFFLTGLWRVKLCQICKIYIGKLPSIWSWSNCLSTSLRCIMRDITII